MTSKKIEEIMSKHLLWIIGKKEGIRADLRGADLCGANLLGANLCRATLCGADLCGADLCRATLCGADLCGADLGGANLCGADLCGAALHRADLGGADLRKANLLGANLLRADLREANLLGANLCRASLCGADLGGANLCGADLGGADLREANIDEVIGLIKIVGVEPGNYYWKRMNADLSCLSYKFNIGLNKLYKNEIFASDERVTCSYPGFHFASRSWCALNYSERPLEVKIRIPEGAQINEPWATDGKASADMIEVVEVWHDGINVTENFI